MKKIVSVILIVMVVGLTLQGFFANCAYASIENYRNHIIDYIDDEIDKSKQYQKELLSLKRDTLKNNATIPKKKDEQFQGLSNNIVEFQDDLFAYLDEELAKSIDYEQKLTAYREFVLKALAKHPLEPLPSFPKFEKPKSTSQEDTKKLIVSRKPIVPKNLEVESVEIERIPPRVPIPTGTKDAANSDNLTLSKALDIATRKSQELKAAQAELESAQAKEKEAHRALYPFFYIEASQGEGKLLEGVEYEEKKYGLSVEHTLFSSGNLETIYKQAKKQVQAARAKVQKAKVDLYFKVTESYFEYVKAVLTYQIQNELYEVVKKDRDSAKSTFKKKLITEEEQMEVRTRYSQVDFQKLSAERDIALARYKLAQNLGLESEAEIESLPQPDTTLDFEGFEVSLDDVFQEALAQRIELRIAQLMLAVSEDEKKIARSKDDFKVDISAFAGRSASYYKTEDENYKNDWNVVLKVTKTFGPNSVEGSYSKNDSSPKLGQSSRTDSQELALKVGIYDNLGNETRIKKAEADYQRSLQELKNVRKDIGVEAHQAYFDYYESVVRVRNSLERIQLAQQRLTSGSYQRRLNQMPLSQVIDAKIKLADEKALYVQALADYKVSLYRLDKAVGDWGKFSTEFSQTKQERSYVSR